MGEFRVYLVDEVTEIGARFIVDPLEEHYRCEILLKVLNLILRQLPLQNVENLFLFATLHLLSEFNYLIFKGDDALDVTAQLLHANRVHLNDFGTDNFDFVVGTTGDFVDEVTNGQLGTFAQDVLNVFALHVLHILDHFQHGSFILATLEPVTTVLAGLTEEQDSLFEHQKVHEETLLFCEKRTVLVLELNHLSNLLVIVFDGVVLRRTIDN